MHSLHRRTDIDGMRAIAILAVLFYHINPMIIPGGFAGVDVFFVISSYLITSIVFNKLSNETFSLSTFYVNRIKRIVPMALLVFSIAVLIASQLNAFLLGSAKYIPLLTYNSHVASYFAYDEQKNFFLHFWSLAIEEQYYLFWPGIVWLMFSAGTKFRVSPRRILFGLSFLIVVVGICYGELMVRDPIATNQVYFFSIPRFAELAIGACVALTEDKIKRTFKTAYLLAFIGVLGLVCSFSFLDQHAYPGLASLVPSLSCACILLACRTHDGESTIMSKILGVKPLEYIGRISYSLYLWHWLVLAVARFVIGSNELPITLVLIFVPLIFLLSALSYHYIELPCIRFNVKSTPKFYASAFGANAAAVFLVVLFAGIGEFNVPPLVGAAHANVTGSDGQNAHLTEGWVAPCWENRLTDRSLHAINSRCAIGDTSKPPRILMVGDSHAAALGSFIDAAGKNEKFSVVTYNVGACQIAEWGLAKRAPGFVRTAERLQECDNMLNFISENYQHYDAIFVVNAFNLFSGNFNIFSNKKEEPPSFNHARLTEISKKTPLIFFYDGPVIDRSLQYSPLLDKLGFTVGASLAVGGSSGNSVIQQLSSSIQNSRWFDLSQGYEQLIERDFLYENRPVYVDTSHLSGYGGSVLYRFFKSSQNNCILCVLESQQAGKIQHAQIDLMHK